MFTLAKIKTCSCCGDTHTEVAYSQSLGIQDGFLWFNCQCGSTLVVPEGQITDEGPQSFANAKAA